MRNKVLVILGVILLILIGAFVLNNKNGVGKTVPPSPTLSQEKIYFDSKTDNQGEVTVEVTPKNLKTGSEKTFQVVLDTHSVPLDQDLMKVSRLKDDQDNTYQPLSWDGGSGGHHLSGTLTFPEVSQSAKAVELIISKIGGVERSFKWTL